MNDIEEVHSERVELARTLKKHVGIRKIVEDLYPDSAHFIYELLQNAEDTGATNAVFKLSEKELVFEHNGRNFCKNDIFAITDIGEGTKANDNDKIGRFGVGFKAVFAYSETPKIYSFPYYFMISDLVLPSEIDACKDGFNKTRFVFPFNNNKKSAELAFSEIKDGFFKINGKTLLFLSNLKSITCLIQDIELFKIKKIIHSENHCELQKQDRKTEYNSHFLKFNKPVENLESQNISIVFSLDFLPDTKTFNSEKPFQEQLKIVPAKPGSVAVFFPAEKETSGLRFHLHAPFVPELSRASIKNTPVNNPLFTQLATLAAEALHVIKDLGLLTVDFLAVLPNSKDPIAEPYQCIRQTIIEAMNMQPLTPTHSDASVSHAPAQQLLQAEASLKKLLTETDLTDLSPNPNIEKPIWAAARQENSEIDNFFKDLSITEWNISKFIDFILKNETKFTDFLSKKSIEWHQQFYCLLHSEYINKKYSFHQFQKLKSLNIIKKMDDSYGCGDSKEASRKIYFPDGSDICEFGINYIDNRVLNFGDNKNQQEEAKKFLSNLGVCHVNEIDLIRLMLKNRYETKHPNYKNEDIDMFIDFLEKNPTRNGLFQKYYIFETEKNDEFEIPGNCYLDTPFEETNLNLWFNFENNSKSSINKKYIACKKGLDKFSAFAKAVGVQTLLKIEKISCSSNPSRIFYDALGAIWTNTSIDEDYYIESLNNFLKEPTEDKVKLVWKRMLESDSSKYLKACCRKNQSNPPLYAPSQLVHALRNSAWIPQKNGEFVVPQQASSDQLPEGFPFDSGAAWIKAIEFGLDTVKKSEAHKQKISMAKQVFDVDDEDKLELLEEIGKYPIDEMRRWIEEKHHQNNFQLPNQESPNPDRRIQRGIEEAKQAPDRRSEERWLSVPIDKSRIRKAERAYLQGQYTNTDGVMICQICKDKLPFKLANGQYYLEGTRLFDQLKKQHHQNNLALCPNHAAMFKHANPSKDQMQTLFKNMEERKLTVQLAGENRTILFTPNHVTDLKAIIAADSAVNDEAE